MKQVDVFLLTNHEYEQIKLHCDNHRPELVIPQWPSIYGIPFEVYATREEIERRAVELALKGKRVGFVESKQKQKSVRYGTVSNRRIKIDRVGWTVADYDWHIVKTRHGYYRMINLNNGRMIGLHFKTLKAAKRKAGVGE